MLNAESIVVNCLVSDAGCVGVAGIAVDIPADEVGILPTWLIADCDLMCGKTKLNC
jgi:hypothetical protein